MLLNIEGVDEVALGKGEGQEQGDVAPRRHMMRWWMIQKRTVKIEKIG
jgi:hypothetical protein